MRKGTRRIPLTQGKYAIVDAVDYDYLNQWSWQVIRHPIKNSPDLCYARRTQRIGKRKYNKKRMFRMHQEVARRMGLPQDRKYDHRDHDGLNNCRSNIRLCTLRQNQWNRRKEKDLTSRYKGVCWEKQTNKWRATIIYNGKQITLGRFISEYQAHLAYCEAAKLLFGEFACAG